MNLEAGTNLLQYRLVEKLGEGGMGVVWKAVDTSLGREVAIKLLPESFAEDADRLARFEREARLLASLNHPNIATIYGLHPSTGSGQALFIAMELIGGEDLAARIARGPLPWDEAREVALGIARALEAAHENGVIHRDLKPANIRLSGDRSGDLSPSVKVLDFGLGKVFEPATRSSDPGLSPTMTSAGTQPGLILGTAAYMSPEQARGRQVDRRTDIWAFGVVLYEMLTGKALFSGETLSDTLAAVLTRQPDLDALPAGTPRRLRRLLERCLERDVARRLQAIGEARIALTDAAAPEELVGPSAVASAAAIPARRKALPLVLTTLVFAAAVAAAFLVGKAGGRAGATAAPPAAGRFTHVTYDDGIETLADLSPDGKSVVYQRSAGGDLDIFLQRVGGENAINLTELSTVDDSQAAFSPDGESIAFQSEREGGGLFVMGATGESVRRLTDFGHNPAWSPDGKHVAFATEPVQNNPLSRGSVSELWTVEVGSGETRRIFEGDAVQPDWSPDGKHVVFWCAGNTGGQRDLATVPAEGGAMTYLTNDVATDWSPEWSPDGRFVYFSSNRGGDFNLWRLPVDESDGRPLGDPEPVTAGVGAEAYHASFSADGTRLTFVSATSVRNIERLTIDPASAAIDPGSLTTVVGGSLSSTFPNVSPDGEWLAFTTSGRPEDLFVQRLDGSQRRRLTSDDAKDRLPLWFPDGQRILFYSDRSGIYQLWTVRPDGSDLEHVEGQPTDDSLLPQISPDGRRVSVRAFRAGQASRILTLDAEGRVASAEILPSPGENLALTITSFSPDDRRAVGELRDPSYRLKGFDLFDFATGTHRTLAHEGAGPIWLDDRRLIFTSPTGLSLIDADRDTAPRTLYTWPSGRVQGQLSLSPDRRHLYFVREQEESDVWMLSLPGGDSADGQP